MAQVITIGPIKHGCPGDADRIDLEVYGINHFKPSYAAMVFVNDPDVALETASTDLPSYAGEFSVFGHERCVGDEGHCAVDDARRRFDTRPSSPLTRAFKRVVLSVSALEAVRVHGEVVLTIVASTGDADRDDASMPLLDCQGLQLVSFGN